LRILKFAYIKDQAIAMRVKKNMFSSFRPWSRYRRCYPRVGKNAFVGCRRFVIVFRYSSYRHKFPDMSKNDVSISFSVPFRFRGRWFESRQSRP